MKPPSASALDLESLCIGSSTLPGIDMSSGLLSMAGTALHKFIETTRIDPARAVDEAPESDKEYFSGLPINEIPMGLSSEVAFSYCPATDEGLVLDIPAARSYPDLGPDWLYGTADLGGVAGDEDGDARIVVCDIKRYQIPRAPADSLQLGVAALAFSRYLKIDQAEVSFIQPSYEGRWRIEKARLDSMDLGAIRQRLLTQAASRKKAEHQLAEGRPIHLRMGSHCTYCRARRGCRAQIGPLMLAVQGNLHQLAKANLPTLEEVRNVVVALDPESRGYLYTKAKLLIEMLGMVVDTVRDDSRTVPTPLGDGKELREMPWSFKEKDAIAKASLAAASDDLEKAGHIHRVATTQVRVVRVRA